jgi:hypothetical protein
MFMASVLTHMNWYYTFMLSDLNDMNVESIFFKKKNLIKIKIKQDGCSRE